MSKLKNVAIKLLGKEPITSEEYVVLEAHLNEVDPSGSEYQNILYELAGYHKVVVWSDKYNKFIEVYEE